MYIYSSKQELQSRRRTEKLNSRLSELKAQEREKVKQGKKPFFLKRSAIKEIALEERYIIVLYYIYIYYHSMFLRYLILFYNYVHMQVRWVEEGRQTVKVPREEAQEELEQGPSLFAFHQIIQSQSQWQWTRWWLLISFWIVPIGMYGKVKLY